MVAQFNFGDVRYCSLHPAAYSKRLWIVLAALCFLLVVPCTLHRPYLHDLRTMSRVAFNCASVNKQLDDKRKTVGKNWIVVTTINPPTDAMEILCNLPGWNVVVVADTKSPAEWKSGSCVYLSLEDQQCLHYGIVDLVPYKAYTRKNIGYLWAIQQGATNVFDTDDDNLPNGKDIIFESPTGSVVGYRSNSTMGKSVNIYSHFGRPDIWPRGFPLEDIDVQRPVTYLPDYNSLSEQTRDTLAPPVLVQQGLADLDPDVDAIFRLTQGQELKHVKFCKKSPSIRLSPGTFCPFNSQNTLFSYDALWGLLLPITVSFRVCDIWRGYWVQRLLWDVNGSLGFTKPTVDQIRNAHNYLVDYKDELQIYAETSKLIDFLADWSSPSSDLATRIIDLMKGMADNKFIGAADVDLAQRWVRDLQRVGYVFPKVRPYEPHAHATALSALKEPRQRVRPAHILSTEALEQCKSEATEDPSMFRIQTTPFVDTELTEKFKDMLVVVNFNHADYGALDQFLAIYKPYFPNIRFYGPNVPSNLKHLVTQNPDDLGWAGYRSLIDAIEKYPNYTGYLYVNDDVVLNVRQLAQFDQNKVWKQVPDTVKDVHDKSKPAPDDWLQWGRPQTGEMWKDPNALTAEQKQRIATFTNVAGPVDIRAFCDAVYVPSRITAELHTVLKRFLDFNVFLELGVGLALLAVEPTTNWESWKEEYLWYDGSRDHWRDFMKPDVSVLHPVKMMLDPKAKTDVIQWIETVEVPPRV